ncbi:hypothetical protein QTO34_004551 [Cnephaeus nilssonii]|uniref:Translation initiation factor beta propellor-like domain-containing protein n=1 Tax=Cnephaeus nilssonii TaxID=3371016 RepID=A0AA40HPH3_CNENI|nr:hypothetical protein QTO34_004551 [Eptesicus nilssonii]
MCLKSTIQKNVQNWCPSWSKMKLFVPEILRMKFTSLKITISIQLQIKIVTVYVPGSKSSPSFVKLYHYPNFNGPALANKSFFKASKVKMPGNKNITAALTASTDVDKTEASYCGEQTLHDTATNGESAVVQVPKMAHLRWTTTFNLKCDPVSDFGTGPHNAAY